MFKTVLYGDPMNERLTKDAWIKHGFDVLRYEGHEKLKADTMAKALGVSRGSFYWHFPSLGDFHDALLDTWRNEDTLDIITQLEVLPDAQAKVAALIQLGIDTPQPLENGMRRWGGVNKKVAAALAQVDEIRMTYLVDQLTGTGLPKQIATERAMLLSWAAIGRAFAPWLMVQTSASTGDSLSKIFLSMLAEEETIESR